MLYTRKCGEIVEEDFGSEQTLCVWLQDTRNLGGIAFLQLRDITGVIQLTLLKKKLGDNYEPYQLEEEFVLVEKLIEDELLLAIPLIPLHSNKKCIGEDVLKAFNVNNKMNSFSALAKLKNSKDQR